MTITEAKTIIEGAHRWRHLHGNLRDLKNGYLVAELYNQLPNNGLSLSGHYKVIWKKDQSEILAYKHGDYSDSAPLTTYKEVEFNGFVTLNEFDKLHLKILVRGSMQYQRPYESGCYMTHGVTFDYDFNLFGVPEYYKLLKTT